MSIRVRMRAPGEGVRALRLESADISGGVVEKEEHSRRGGADSRLIDNYPLWVEGVIVRVHP